MSRIASFDYSSAYAPPAPFLPIAVDGYDGAKPPVMLSAFVDSGADGTMLPLDVLRAVGAEYEDTVRLRGTAGGVQQLDRYTVRIQLASETIHAVSAVATAEGSEALIGRDVLNALVVTLNGLAGVTEVQFGARLVRYGNELR